MYADLQAALESSRGDDHWTSRWHVTLGAVAGLLIAKWAGCREALGLSDADQPAEEHARALVQALGEASRRTANLRDSDPFRLPVMAAATTLPETYKAIITWLRGVDLGSPDGREIAARAFDAAVRATVQRNGRDAGEYMTPSQVVNLMLELVAPKPAEKIYDPCFGFGGLLAGAARRITAPESGSTAQSSGQRVSIFGMEIGPAQYAIGLCRLLLAGVPGCGLVYGDALDGPFPEEAFLGPLRDAGSEFEDSARKEIVNWTGGVPVLVCALLRRLLEEHAGTRLLKSQIDRAAEEVLAERGQLLAALWG